MELSRIKPLMVPAAWVLVGALVLRQATTVTSLLTGQEAGFDSVLSWLPALLAIVVGLAIGWGHAGPKARPAAMAALALTATSVLALLAAGSVSIAAVVRTATTPWAVVAQSLLWLSLLLVPVLALVVLARLLPLTAGSLAAADRALPARSDPQAAQEPSSQTGQPAVWQPDRAVGAHWHTAGAAAAGAAAIDWGKPGGERGGWAPGRPAVGTGQPLESGADRRAVGPGAAGGGTPPRPPADFGPRSTDRVGSGPGPEELARRYASNAEDVTGVVPPEAGRQRPRWTPLGDPAQPPARD